MDADTLKKFEKARKWSSIAFISAFIISEIILAIALYATYNWPLKIAQLIFNIGTAATFAVLVPGSYAFYCMWRCQKAKKEMQTPVNQ